MRANAGTNVATLLAVAFAATLVPCVLAGCGAILGLKERGLEDEDASTSEGGSGERDGGGDPSGDGGDSTDGSNPTTEAGHDPDSGLPANCTFDKDGYGEVTSAACWETVDYAAVAPGASVGATEGIGFDGRYMYFAPRAGSAVLRYDTSAAFAAASSWATFDVKKELGFLPRFSGAVFDGRYVTFVPRSSSPMVVRYDTKSAFTASSSWDSFDPTTLGADAVGFAGGAYDGSHVYLVPQDHTTVLRHDAAAAANAGWQKFDLGSLGLGPLAAFFGAVFDGHGLVLAPEGDGVVVRFDTTASFTAIGSWSKFDTTALYPSGTTFTCGAFDGRYVYLSPGGGDSVVARYDSQATFSNAAAWSVYDMGRLTNALGLFQGASFDGRFVYFAPNGTINSQPNRWLGRYDTTKSFDQDGAWLTFDTKLGPFTSTAFDGRFVYFAPWGSSSLSRFAARRTAQNLSLPSFFGSFF